MCKTRKVDEIFNSEIIDIADDKRLQRAKKCKSTYSKLIFRTSDSRTKTLIFSVVDPEGSGKTREVRIKIPDFKSVSRLRKNITTREKLELALEAGDVFVSCTCEDQKYMGYQYIGTKLGYSIDPENRSPKKRNPLLLGSVCKHIISTFLNYKTFLDKISSDVDKYSPKRESNFFETTVSADAGTFSDYKYNRRKKKRKTKTASSEIKRMIESPLSVDDIYEELLKIK